MGIALQRIESTPGEGNNTDYLRDLGYQDVSIEVNDQCNFHCIYCPYDMDKTHEMSVMDQQSARTLIERLAEDQALDGYLLFNVLGEPLMYSGLFDLIKYANSKNLKTKVVTNGSLLTKKNIEGLLDASPTFLKVSVESLDPTVFAELRGTTIKFDTYVSRVQNLISAAINAGDQFKTRIQLDIIYANGKVHAVNRILGLEAKDLGRKGLYSGKNRLLKDIKVFLSKLADKGDLPATSIADLAPDDTAYGDNSIPFIPIAPNIAIHIKTYNRWIDIFNRKYPVNNSGRGCSIPNLGIHANGDVVLCCIDYNASTVLGNVFHHDIRNIMTNEKNVKIIQDLRGGIFHFEACRSCQGHQTMIGKISYGAIRQKQVRRPLKVVKTTVMGAIGR